MYHDSEETPRIRPLHIEKVWKYFQRIERAPRKQFAVSKKLLYTTKLFLILFFFQKNYFSVATSWHKFLWMAMFSHKPCSCLAVFINVRLFHHKNKFLPQCIVTWSNQNEINSFQTDSFSQLMNSQKRHWSGFTTDDFVEWAYFTSGRLERDRKWKSVNLLCCPWMTITNRILNRLPQNNVLWNPCFLWK